MLRRLLAICSLLAALLALAAAPPPSSRRILPAKERPLPVYYRYLGLSEDQKRSAWATGDDFKRRREDLQRQLDLLKVEEREALEEILTPEQRERLQKLREALPGDLHRWKILPSSRGDPGAAPGRKQ